MSTVVEHPVRIRKETKAEHRSEMAVRKEAEKQLRPIQRIERQVERAQEETRQKAPRVTVRRCYYYPLSDYRTGLSSGAVRAGNNTDISDNEASHHESEGSETYYSLSSQLHHLNDFVLARHRHRGTIAHGSAPAEEHISRALTGISDLMCRGPVQEKESNIQPAYWMVGHVATKQHDDMERRLSWHLSWH